MLPAMINRIPLLQLLILPTVAGAYDMTRRDRMAILYSNQVVFDKRGEPLVSVRITEGQDTVQFSSSGRLVLMPGGDEGSQVFSPAKTEWTVRLEQGKPGQSEWWVAAERVSASDVSVVAARRQAWTNKGFKVRIFEAGALLGLSGKNPDTSITIGIEPQSTQKAAETLAAKLADQLTLKNAVISEPKGDHLAGFTHGNEKLVSKLKAVTFCGSPHPTTAPPALKN